MVSFSNFNCSKQNSLKNWLPSNRLSDHVAVITFHQIYKDNKYFFLLFFIKLKKYAVMNMCIIFKVVFKLNVFFLVVKPSKVEKN